MTDYITQFSLAIIVLLFFAASTVVWFSGLRLSKYADALATNTGTSDVAIGTLLLGGVTSLPEVVTTITASSLGNADIALNNLFGGVALQVTILVVADAMLKKVSISSVIDSPVVSLQAMIGILLLSTAAGLILINDLVIIQIGLGSVVILSLFISGFFLINYLQSIHWWKSDPAARNDIPSVKQAISNVAEQEKKMEVSKKEEKGEKKSFRGILKSKLSVYFLLSSAGVLAGGYVVVNTGQAIASKTNLSASFIGAIFIAVSTSLPELSTTVSLARLQKYRLVFSNILGTNIYTIGFVFLADVFYNKGAILNHGGNFSLFAALLGIVLTTFYLIGFSIRMKKTFFHLGYDSLLVLVVYLSGLFIMYNFER